MSSTPMTPSIPKGRHTRRSTNASADKSAMKSALSGFSTPQRRRVRGFEASGSTPSTLLASMSGNLHFYNDTPLVTSSRVTPSTPSSSARRQPSTPATTRRLSRTPRSSSQGDRFIPHRPSINFDFCNHMLRNGVNAENEPQAGSETSTPLRLEFRQAMKNALLTSTPAGYSGAKSNCKGVSTCRGLSPRLLSFSEKPLRKEERCTNVLKVLHSISNTSTARASVSRSIPSSPLRILDAPDMVDDYYLNLISWGHNNVLAVALGQSVYLWNATTGSIDHLLTLQDPNNFVTSVEWMGKDGGSFLAVGTNHSAIELWDGSKLKLVRTMMGHSARVGTLAWKRHILSSGSRDCSILQHDIRMAQHKIATFAGHEQEVCGLKWSPDESTLASGGNENFLCLWDANMSGGGAGRRGLRQGSSSSVHRPRNTLVQHQAAVKALAWCPFQRHLLASGGGSADRTIKFWNTANGSMLDSIDTGSQVCSLQWSRHKKEIVSSHGFSENQLCLWKYPSMLKVKEFRGHTSRVLHMDTSPDGCTVVSAAADETLRFWDMFGTPGNKCRKGDKGMEHGIPGSLTTMLSLR